MASDSHFCQCYEPVTLARGLYAGRYTAEAVA